MGHLASESLNKQVNWEREGNEARILTDEGNFDDSLDNVNERDDLVENERERNEQGNE